MEEMQTFSEDFVVQPIDCDLQDRMTLGALLRWAQQIAGDHCDAIGLTTEYLFHHGAVFLLAKVGLELSRPIHSGESFRVTTRPCAPRHAFYNRYTTLCTPEGEPVVRMDARWVLVDPETHRVLRRPPEGLVFPFGDWVDEEQDLSILRAENPSPAGNAAAVYSRVDINGHLNNTYYGDILCDALPVSLWRQPEYLCKAVLYYRLELPFGEQMALSRGEISQTEGSGWYVEGIRGGHRCFEGNLYFTK